MTVSGRGDQCHNSILKLNINIEATFHQNYIVVNLALSFIKFATLELRQKCFLMRVHFYLDVPWVPGISVLEEPNKVHQPICYFKVFLIFSICSWIHWKIYGAADKTLEFLYVGNDTSPSPKEGQGMRWFQKNLSGSKLRIRGNSKKRRTRSRVLISSETFLR